MERMESPVKPVPISEKPSSVRLVDPTTNTYVCAKLSRIVTTQAQVNGGRICMNYFSREGCALNQMCPFVHVAGKEHTWTLIEPTLSSPEGTYSPGFVVRCYDVSLVKYLEIPSNFVVPTSGSASYIEHYNNSGENFKARYQLCAQFSAGAACPLGDRCPAIHCTTFNYLSFQCYDTHIGDEPSLLRYYRRLPADVTVRAYQQNSSDDYEDFPGDAVLLTQGAQLYVDLFRNEGNQFPRKKMQHCAHFRLKRLCRMGEACKFIHVIPAPKPNSPNTSFASAAKSSPTDDEVQGLVQTSPMRSPRSGTESPSSDKNVVVKTATRRSGYRSPTLADVPVPVAPKPTLGNVAAMFASRIPAQQQQQQSTGVDTLGFNPNAQMRQLGPHEIGGRFPTQAVVHFQGHQQGLMHPQQQGVQPQQYGGAPGYYSATTQFGYGGSGPPQQS